MLHSNASIASSRLAVTWVTFYGASPCLQSNSFRGYASHSYFLFARVLLMHRLRAQLSVAGLYLLMRFRSEEVLKSVQYLTLPQDCNCCTFIPNEISTNISSSTLPHFRYYYHSINLVLSFLVNRVTSISHLVHELALHCMNLFSSFLYFLLWTFKI
ncbi:hypothetical protein B0O99DRAFT_55004 [Bisporella sp. PMI_857]|nr:hypothetical protein B0O99DRAFT_55004 [Bisporella sp. PMI_857]